MTDEEPVSIEVIDAGEADETTVRRETDGRAIHSWLRTGAVVVAALSLVWAGVSLAGMRDASEREACIIELQMASFGPFASGSSLGRDHGEDLLERAEECGLPVLAQQFRQQFDLDDDEDDG